MLMVHTVMEGLEEFEEEFSNCDLEESLKMDLCFFLVYLEKYTVHLYIVDYIEIEMVSCDCNLYKIVKYPYTAIRNDWRRHGNSLAKKSPFNGRNSFSSIQFFFVLFLF